MHFEITYSLLICLWKNRANKSYLIFHFSVFHKTSFTKKHALIMIASVWSLGPAVNMARLIPTSTVTPEGICIQNLIWPSQFWFTFASVIICVLLFFFPLIFIMTLYLSIFIALRRKTQKNITGESSDNRSNKISQAKTNVLKTLTFLTVLFFLCWVWNITFFFLFTLGVNVPTSGPFYNFSIFMVNVNCCVNPFCYALQYREFQAQAKVLFCRGSV